MGKLSNSTRERLMQTAFEEIHRAGFQAASLADILARSEMSKGALYHYFPDKKQLGLAVLEEVIRPFLAAAVFTPLREATHPWATLRELWGPQGALARNLDITRGCPLNNLIQEMSPLDADFRRQLAAMLDDWIGAVADAIQRAQRQGVVRPQVDADQAAQFLVSSLEGCIGMAKALQSPTHLMACIGQLNLYLDALETT
jgi:AcrR family transcriptional regulator